MKKILFSFLALTFLTSICLADCSCNKPEPDCECKKDPCTIEKLNKCTPTQDEDDEYCTYNQCYFDKKFRNMKKALCLSKKQEVCIDNIYRNFKADMEQQHARYRAIKNKTLEMIECENDCYKSQVKALKELKKETKEKAKEYKKDLKDQLCKNQYSALRKYARHEKKKMKKIKKYAAVYKFPCVNCCN